MKLGILLVAVALAVTACSGDDDDEAVPSSSTTTVEALPDEYPDADADVAEETLEWLDGDGAGLLVMHDAANSIAGREPRPVRCEEIIDELDAEAPSPEMLNLAGGVADEVLRSLLLDERTHLGVVLTGCVTGQEPEIDHRDGLADAVDLIDRRLAELEELT